MRRTGSLYPPKQWTFLVLALFIFIVRAPASAAPVRIVSLAPSMTELLFALGAGDRVVGVTSFCDYPEEARSKEKIGGMSNPSLEAVVRLRPDLVVLTTDGNQREFEERLRSLKIPTYVSRTKRIAELPQAVRALGAAIGANQRAESLARDIEERIRAAGIRHSAAYPQRQPKVLFIIWPEPLVVAGPGSLVDDALAILGAANIAKEAAAPYPKYSIEEVFRQAPDFIFIGLDMVAAGGKGAARAGDISRGLLKRLKGVPAVKNGRVYYVTDQLYRLGPRLVNGIEELGRHLETIQ